MNTNYHPQTAKIFQFPTPTAAAARRFENEARALLDVGAPRISDAAFGSWYHDAAIGETKSTPKT